MGTAFDGFSATEEAMLAVALLALQGVGYDTDLLQVLIRADMPAGYRGMSFNDGAVLGAEAFQSQDWLNHVLEEEFLHLRQKQQGLSDSFTRGTALELESAVNEQRRFPAPS